MWNLTVFIVFNTLWTYIFIISSIFTVAEDGINDIYDVVSSWERGSKSVIDLREIFAIY